MHRFLCEKLQRVIAGECKRLMIFTPPRHGKSELVSKRFPAWYLGRNPTGQIISASYGSDLAADFGREVRNIVAAKTFQALFPGVYLAPDSQAKIRWHTKDGGSYVAAGVGTSITGRGADILNIDDPVKDKAEAESESIRQSTWDWYQATAYTRLMPQAAIILTMTRWHPADLAGRLLEEMKNGKDQWEIVDLPAFAQAHDLLGRPPGAALWPERYDEKALGEIQLAIGDHNFQSLYMQNPQPHGSAFFDVAKCLINNQPVMMPTTCDAVFAVMDTASKDGAQHDGSAVSYFAINRHVGYRLVMLDWDIFQIKGAFLQDKIPGVFDRLQMLAKRCGARMGSLGLWIEDKNSGTVLIQQGSAHGIVHSIDSVLTSKGKDGRAINASNYTEKGDVKIADEAYNKVTEYKGDTANHMLKQVFGFRLGVDNKKDDLLDTFCYGVAIALGNSEGF